MFFVCGLAAVLAVLSVLWQPCLFIRGEQGAVAVIPMWKDLPVSISFIHSVQKTPVQENLVARADGSGFELISTKYQSFGVGLPFLESEGEFREEGDYEMLFVLNKARPLTRTVRDALEVFYEIEAACSLPFTAIVNNTNLGPLTTPEDVIAGERFAEEVARCVGLPVKMSCASEKLAAQLQNKVSNFFPIQIMQLYYMEKEGTSLGKINL